MRTVMIALFVVLCVGLACASDDDIARQLEQEALRAIDSHKTKLQTEEAAQREKDQEIEAQRALQAAQIRKEAEEKKLQERLKQAAIQLEEERRAKVELEEQMKREQAEAAARAKIAEIKARMQEFMQREEMLDQLRQMNSQQAFKNQVDAQKAHQDALNRFTEGVAADRHRNQVEEDLRRIRQLEQWRWMRGR
ncbi:hypothetical protein [Desulfomonile tiedjei]|uniref:Uncharacterized protein n=1 Tax=Desulfomonile tiedjei (strain ATCC 49306 / DSM 6799 / DCB-1) TaxID=706587 RepID=I4C2C8_DESTA|nr:hypothetical protein [Desulfomonile tiedjei]AFM23719.1 hypothetical protein Desti_1001 [Desulfomonile tiedjei DSM 6799]